MRNRDAAAIRPVRAIDQPHEFGAACADQPADAKYLAGFYFKRYVAYGVAARHALYRECGRADPAFAEIDTLANIASDH
jgi:hypothetical protein